MATKKNDLVLRISRELGLGQVDVKKVVQRTLDLMIDALAEEGRIELRGFGIFSVCTRKPREGRNPRTGEAVAIPARKVVTFKVGAEMKARILSDTSTGD